MTTHTTMSVNIASAASITVLPLLLSHANPNLVRAYVKRLRGKLGDDTGNPTYILSGEPERGLSVET